MYLRKGHIGKTAEQQLLEDRELRNFTMVLSKLIENDAFCREMIVVEMEGQQIRVIGICIQIKNMDNLQLFTYEQVLAEINNDVNHLLIANGFN